MAKYRMEEMNDLHHTGERRLYPRLEIIKQTNLNELAEWISGGTTFTPGDIIGVIGALRERMAKFLADGYSVKIDGIGNFTASLKLREGCEPELAESGGKKHNARSIQIRSVHFRPEKEFVGKINTLFVPERSRQKSRRSSSAYTLEERLTLARNYLHTAPYLTVADYCRLTGLLRTTAAKELRLYAAVADSGFRASGSGSHRVYVRTDR